jgi:hypothetical protein
MSKILFLDIDGVLIPSRAYMLPNQTKPIVSTFDPCSVSLLVDAVKRSKRKIVLHSSWIRTKFLASEVHDGDVVGHCIKQGIPSELFHDDPYCCRDTSYRYDRVTKWLTDHPDTTEYVIVDDEPVEGDYKCKSHLIQTDFDEGITINIYNKIATGYFPI